MKRNLGIILAMGVGMVSSVALAGWNDNFDSESPAENTVPAGYAGVWGGGTLDKGITDSVSVSAPNSAYVAVDITAVSNQFRSILLHSEVAPMDLTGGTLSVRLSTDVALQAAGGVVGFHLYSADGGEFGTLPEERFAPTPTFSEFAQDVSALTNVIAYGTGAPFDTTNVVKYALDFFSPTGGVAQVVVFYIDDFKGEEMPIPPFDGDVGLGLEYATNAVDLSWYAGYGSSYQLQYSEDLNTTNWVDLGSLFMGDNSTNHVVDPATNACRIYKVKVVQ